MYKDVPLREMCHVKKIAAPYTFKKVPDSVLDEIVEKHLVGGKFHQK